MMRTLLGVFMAGLLLSGCEAVSCDSPNADACPSDCKVSRSLSCASCGPGEGGPIALEVVAISQAGVAADKAGGLDIAKPMTVAATAAKPYDQTAKDLQVDIAISICTKPFFGSCKWRTEPTKGLTYGLSLCDPASGVSVLPPNDCHLSKPVKQIGLLVDLAANPHIQPLIGTIKLVAGHKRAELKITIRDGGKVLSCLRVFDYLL